MNDPHVVSLRYRLETDDSVEFSKKTHPVEAETEHFRLRLADGQVVVEMKEHHATADTARQRVEPFLEARRVAAYLNEGWAGFHFGYTDADIIDRNPTPGVATISITSPIKFNCSAVGLAIRSRYPAPPTELSGTPNVLLLWRRYEQMLLGREPLLSAAYACLTHIEGTTGLVAGANRRRRTVFRRARHPKKSG